MKLIVAFRNVANGDNGFTVMYSIGTDKAVWGFWFPNRFS